MNENIPDWEYYFTMLDDIAERGKHPLLCIMVDPYDVVHLAKRCNDFEQLSMLATLIARASIDTGLSVEVILQAIKQAAENAIGEMKKEDEEKN